MFSIVYEIKELIISQQPNVRLTLGLDQNIAFLMNK